MKKVRVLVLKARAISRIKAEAQLYQGRRRLCSEERKHGSSNRLDDSGGDGQSERRADSSRGFKVSDCVSYKSSNGYARTGVIDTTHPSDGNATTCIPDKKCHLSLQSHAIASSTSIASPLKAISLWQPWAFLIPMRLKHYETRGWKTDYRGRLLIASAKKLSSSGRQIYLEIARSHGIDLEKHPWHTLPLGYAIAVCDLTDCIQITPELIAQHSQTEIDCGDWTPGRYAWKLENVQPLLKPIPVKGQQGLWNVDPSILGEETGSHEVGSCTCPSCEQSLLNLDDACGVCGWTRSQSREEAVLTVNSSVTVSTPAKETVLTVNCCDSSTISTSVGEAVLTVNLTSSTVSTRKRKRGEGTGRIQWRTFTKKNGKQYQQPWYDWQIHQGEKTISKSTYIPKRLLSRIQELEDMKAPVRDILIELGIIK